MKRIAINIIGPMDEDLGLKYIIVIIDTFTRYVEHTSPQNKMYLPWKQLMPYGDIPLEIVIKHQRTIPYSKVSWNVLIKM